MSEPFAELAHRPPPIELQIKKSIFLTQLTGVADEAEARAAIAEARGLNPQARHHCSAFVLGPSQSVQRSNDDGEPAGTAGMPMLQSLVLHRVATADRDLVVSDVVAVVTRWFGGVKLGAGGLTRAYSSSVSEALQAATWVRREAVAVHELAVPLADIGRVESVMRNHGVAVLDTRYAAEGAVVEVGVAAPEHDHVTEVVAQLLGHPLPAPVEHRWERRPITP